MTKKLFGTQRSRHRAGLLKAEWLYDDHWKVTGGLAPHIVIAGQYGKPETFQCDCQSWNTSKDGACSHILCVMGAM